MAKKQASSSGTSTPQKTTASTTAIPSSLSSAPPSSSKISTPAPSSTSSPSNPGQLSSRSSPQDIALHVWSQYLRSTPPRTKLLDTFMAFLVAVGALQFVYCVVAGNYPFNAFLSGFCAAVGQFVLLASLRMQTSSSNPNASSVHGTSSIISQTTSSSTAVSGKDKASRDVIEDLGLGGKGYSQERAFADFVFGSVILHAFCVNFIN